MFCKKCGKELKDGAVFCSSCGQKVLMSASSAQVRQPEEQKPAGRVSAPAPAGKSGSAVNLILVIAVCTAVLVTAAVGYFLWSGHFNAPSEDDRMTETMGDSAGERQEPEMFGDEGDSALYRSAEEPEEAETVGESEPAGEPEEEEPEEEEVSQYFLPTSNTEYLTMSDLEGFSQDDCRMARNELYARHGRRFDDPNLQAYFDALDWYEGTTEPADFDESVMNEYEIANRDLIVQYEKDRGYR